MLPVLLPLYHRTADQGSACTLRFLTCFGTVIGALTRPDTKLHHQKCFTALMQVPVHAALRTHGGGRDRGWG